MKEKLLLMILFFGFEAFGQIQSFLGISDYDSCNFEFQFQYVDLISDSSTTNIWQIGEVQKQNFNQAFSDSLVIVTDTINTYPIQNHSFFDLKIPNYAFTNTIIAFRHKFDTDSLIDGGYIECSYDMGQTWTNVILDQQVNFPQDFFSENLYTQNDSLAGVNFGFSGSTHEWIETKIQWVFAYPVRSMVPDTFMLRFNFISDSIQTNKDGWMIDNFRISFADLGSGIHELSSSNLEISPNPTRDIIRFDSEINFKRIQLFDLLGNLIQTENFTSNKELSLKNLPSGMYVLHVENDRDFITKRIIKE